MMLIQNEFELGATVYLVTDKEQAPRMVTMIQVSPGQGIAYRLACGSQESCHFPCEISQEPNLVLSNS
jgi:hypothetical protein